MGLPVIYCITVNPYAYVQGDVVEHVKKPPKRKPFCRIKTPQQSWRKAKARERRGGGVPAYGTL